MSCSLATVFWLFCFCLNYSRSPFAMLLRIQNVTYYSYYELHAIFFQETTVFEPTVKSPETKTIKDQLEFKINHLHF